MIELRDVDVTRPFPGLRPFETDEYHFFFGREGQSDALVARLGEAHFLAVVGTSGSGKSSLIRAGLLPALQGGLMREAGSAWRIAVMRPGADPVGNLARALAAEGVHAPGGGDGGGDPLTTVETTLRRSTLGLVDAVRQARLAAGENVLVVADQFEELFRFRDARRPRGNDEDDDVAFVKLLLEAARQRELPIYVVITMRSDFLGDCARFWGLPEAINEGQYLIPRMTRDEQRMAITGPAAVGGGGIAAPLVNRLLNEMGDDPAHLPTLQHALMRSWDYWAARRRRDSKQGRDAGPVGLEDYVAVGTMADALSLHADEAWKELDERQKIIAERMFKALTEKGADNREIRRPTRLAELCAITGATEDEVKAVVDVFRGGGRSFLMPPAEVRLDAECVIDISHESLIRNWKRLRKWVDEEAEAARDYRRIAESAGRNLRRKESLWSDPQLQLALDWLEARRPNKAWARRYHPHFYIALDFLRRSAAARDAQRLAAAEAEQQRAEQQRRELEQTKAINELQDKNLRIHEKNLRRLRLMAATLGVFLALAVVATFFAWRAQAEAEDSKLDALRSERAALVAEGRALREKIEAERLKGVAEGEKKAAEEQRRIAADRAVEVEKANVKLQGALADAETARNDARAKQAEAERLRDEAIAAGAANQKYRQAVGYSKQGNTTEALAKFKAAVADFERIPDARGIAASYLELGDLLREQASDSDFKQLSDELDDDTYLGQDGDSGERAAVASMHEYYDKAKQTYSGLGGRDGDTGVAAVLASEGEHYVQSSYDLKSYLLETDEKAAQKAAFDKGITLWEEALKKYERQGNHASALFMLNKLAGAFQTSDKQRAFGYYERSLKHLRELKNLPELSATLLKVARYYQEKDDVERAKPFFKEAAGLYKDRDRLREIESLLRVAEADSILDEQHDGYLPRALALARGLNDVQDEARALTAIATAQLQPHSRVPAEKIPAPARANFKDALALYKQLPPEKLTSNSMTFWGTARTISDVAADDEARELALEYARLGLAAVVGEGDRRAERSWLPVVAEYAEKANQLGLAIEYHSRIAALEGGSRESLLERTKVAELQRRAKRLPESLQTYRELLKALESQNDPFQKALVHRGFGVALVESGKHAEAAESFEQGVAILRSLNDNTLLLPEMLLQLAAARETLNQLPGALKSYEEALEVYQKRHSYANMSGKIEAKVKELRQKLSPQ